MFFSLKKFNLLTFSDFERKTSGNCQSKFSGIVKTAFCLWTFSGKWTFCEKCTLSFHRLFSDTAWKNSGLSICPLENFEEKLWFFWKKYRFFLLSGLFRYKARIFSSSLSNVHCTCKWEPPERENYYFFESKHSLLSLSDIVRKISGAASGFFSAELPKLLPTCLWKQYEEKQLSKERLYFLPLLCIKQSFLRLMAEIFREWCQKGILRVYVNRLRKPSFEN